MYLLHAKNEAFSSFKIYKNEVEIQIGCKLKRLRTDTRGEYCDPCCFQSIGIIHEITVGYAPQSNGVVKGKTVLFKRR